MYKTLKYERDFWTSLISKEKFPSFFPPFIYRFLTSSRLFLFKLSRGAFLSLRVPSLSPSSSVQNKTRGLTTTTTILPQNDESQIRTCDDDETINHRRRRRRRTKKKRRTRRRRWCFDEMVGRDEHRPQASDRALVRHRVSARELGVRT